MSATRTVVPPGNVAGRIDIRGKVYVSTDGSSVTMPEGHATIAAANGWQVVPDWAPDVGVQGPQGYQGGGGAQGNQGAQGSQGNQGAQGAGG